MNDETRIPPQALETERTILGSMIADTACCSIAIELLTENSFYLGANRIIYITLRDMFLKNIPIDETTLINSLENKNQLDSIGGDEYIYEIAGSMVTFKNMEYHCNILIDKQERREGIKTSEEWKNSLFDDTEISGKEITNRIISKVITSRKNGRSKTVKIGSLLSEEFDRIEAIQKGTPAADLKTGYPTLDELIFIQNGDNIVLAGRPSMGKSSVTDCIIRRVAAQGKRILKIVLETTKKSELRKSLFSEAKVSLHLFHSGLLPRSELPKLSAAAAKINELEIYIDDSPNITPSILYSKIHRIQHEIGKIDLLTFDYLQLMSSDHKYGNRNLEVGDHSKQIKNIGMEFDFPTITISQLSRPPKGVKPTRPTLSDLRESGAIEQNGDIVILLHRPEYYMNQKKAVESGVENKIEIIIAKNRNGPAAIVKEMVYLKEFMSLEEKSEQPGEAVDMWQNKI